MLQPLEDAVRLHFIPSITGRDSISDIERDLFVLPAHLVGLALSNLTASVSFEYSSSIYHSPSCPLYIQLLQCMDLPHSTFVDQKQVKATVHLLRHQLHSSELHGVAQSYPASTHVRSIWNSIVKKVSLSVLPISDHGFALRKGASMMQYVFGTIGTHHTYQGSVSAKFFQHRSCTQTGAWFSICSSQRSERFYS